MSRPPDPLVGLVVPASGAACLPSHPDLGDPAASFRAEHVVRQAEHDERMRQQHAAALQAERERPRPVPPCAAGPWRVEPDPRQPAWLLLAGPDNPYDRALLAESSYRGVLEEMAAVHNGRIDGPPCPRCGAPRGQMALLCGACWQECPRDLRTAWARMLQNRLTHSTAAKKILAWAKPPAPASPPLEAAATPGPGDDHA